MILSSKRITQALISLGGCTGWSAPLLFTNQQRQVFSHQGPYLRNYYPISFKVNAIFLSQCMRFPTMWYVQPASLRSACAYAQSDQSLCSSLEYSMTVKLLTENHLEFLSLKGGCTGSFVWVYTCQNATLLEIICQGFFNIALHFHLKAKFILFS